MEPSIGPAEFPFKVGDKVRTGFSEARTVRRVGVSDGEWGRIGEPVAFLSSTVQPDGQATDVPWFADELSLVERAAARPIVGHFHGPQTFATLPLDSVARKEVPLFRGLLRYFPAALAWTARISKLGNDKHNAGEEMHHARGKSSDHADCILRHMMDLDADYGKGVGRDENGVPQVGYVVWRALALAQEWLEANDGAPFAPGARK